MKKFFYYILMAALIGGTIPFTSCSDDDETMNEWIWRMFLCCL